MGATLPRSPWGSVGTAKRRLRARGVLGCSDNSSPCLYNLPRKWPFFSRSMGTLLQDYRQGRQAFWAHVWMDTRYKACPNPPDF